MRKFSRALFLCLLFGVAGLPAAEESTPTKGSHKAGNAHAEMTPAQIEACKKTFATWREKYLGGTPYAASNKANKLTPFDTTTLGLVLNGKRTVGYVDENKKPITRDLMKDHTKLRALISAAQPPESFDRFELNTAYASHLVRNNPEDNLLIIFSGTMHARDYFFESPKGDVAYAEKEVTHQTINFSPKFYDFMNQLLTDLYARKPPLSGERIEQIATSLFLEYASQFPLQTKKGDPLKPLPASPFALERYLEGLADLYANEANKGRVTPQELLREPVERPNKIFLGDNHTLDGLAPITDMPSASCLRVMGFNSISIAFEPLGRRPEPYSLKDAVAMLNYPRRLDQEGSIRLSPKTVVSLGQFVKMESPKADQILQTDEAQICPGDMLLLNKAIELNKSGLPVKIQGLEFDPSNKGNQEWLRLLRAWISERRSPTPNAKKITTIEADLTKLSPF